MTRKWVYLSSEVEGAEAYAGDRNGVRVLLGGKGANQAELTQLGETTRPGFTVTTEACTAFLEAGEQFPAGLWAQVLDALEATEERGQEVR